MFTGLSLLLDEASNAMRLKNFSLSFGSRIFKALSDESRVRILNLLMHHSELTISDIEILLDFTQTKTSRHMNYLKNAGIVSARRSDQWIFYQVKEEVQDLLGQVMGYLHRDQMLMKDLEDFKTMQSNRELAAFRQHNRAGSAF
jgi:ArsR family transcriptional regulator